MLPINVLLGFQLEDYHISRFVCFIYTHITFRFKGSKRQHLVWTKKAVLLFGLSNLLFIGTIIGIILSFKISCLSLVLTIACITLYPCFLVLSEWLIYPIELLFKKTIIFKAKQRVKQCSKVKIIGITGSYGKTSVKEYLKFILQDSFEVIAPIGTHNTLLGMSNFILKELKPTTQIMIVEMGAYVPGDIAQLCDIAQPNIAVITGITAQHLERFKSLDRIISTKFEITKKLKKNDDLFVDGDNEAIKKGLDRFCKKIDYSIHEIGSVTSKCLPDFQGISFIYDNVEYTTKLLGRHNAKNLSLAIAIAQTLGLDIKLIQKKVGKIGFVSHRLELIYNGKSGIYVIDDSFNGNIEGVKSTMDLLQNTPFQGKRIYLTPGLVELGKASDDVHLQIGEMLSKSADIVALIQNQGTCKIKECLLNSGFPEKNIITFETSIQAHKEIGKYAHSGDVIVFQNDLTDNYF